MNLKFNLEYYLPHQRDFLTCNAREKALVAGLGAGKTYIFVDDELRKHIQLRGKNGKSNGWVIYPTYDLADELFVEPFKERLDKVGIRYDYNGSKHRFKTNYGDLKIYQLQRPERIIGSNLTSVGFDEFDVESWKNCDVAYRKSIGRMRGCENPQMSFVGTPEGFKYLYKLFDVELAKKPHRAVFHAVSTDNPYLPKSYIDNLYDTYSEELVKAYINGEFTNLTQGTVYSSFNKDRNVKVDNMQGRLIAGMDFNVGKMVCVLGWDHGHRIHWFKEVILQNSNTYEMAEELRRLRLNPIIYPDATGKNRESNASESDHAILRKAGFIVITPGRNPYEKDRINAVNGLLYNGNHDVRMTVDPSCVELIADLEQVVYDSYGKIDKSNVERTHASDAMGYPVFALHGHRVANLRYGRRTA